MIAASIAASIAERAGAKQVINLLGGHRSLEKGWFAGGNRESSASSSHGQLNVSLKHWIVASRLSIEFEQQLD